jgi:hypothetical protein
MTTNLRVEPLGGTNISHMDDNYTSSQHGLKGLCHDIFRLRFFFSIKQLILAPIDMVRWSWIFPELLLSVINSPEYSGPGRVSIWILKDFFQTWSLVIKVDSPLMSTPGSLDFLVYLVPATELVYKRTCWCHVCTSWSRYFPKKQH